jgi:hypothetical protein
MGHAPAIRLALDRPLSGAACVASWVIATALFFGMIALLGGPSEVDASQSLYDTWAIAHGDVACAYAPHAPTTQSFFPEYAVIAHTAPFWPLVSGGISAATRIGHEVPFPSREALGADCGNTYTASYAWAQDVRSLLPTTGIGYASWFALLAGVVAVLRAMRRGRCGWEALGVILVGLSPVAWMPILEDYHPEDLLAVGLILGAVACFRRRQWAWAGVLLGLAVTSQQFALLALVPLAVVAPGPGRRNMVVSSALAWGAVTLPLIGVTSGRALASVVIGTGNSFTFGGTILWETGMRSDALTFCSRVLPVLLSVVLAVWVHRRLGLRALGSLPLLSLVATCLSLRVVFEEGLFGYKFMALGVMLVLLDVVRGRISAPLIVWLTLLTVAFNPVPVQLAANARPWGYDAALGLDLFVVAIGLALIVWDACQRRVRWYLVGGVVLVIAAIWHLQPLLTTQRAPLPLWLWQIVLVSSGVVMAAAPLVSELRKADVAVPLTAPPAARFVPKSWRPAGLPTPLLREDASAGLVPSP